MRALCGAIITAGALIGLGLLGIGLGTRYAHETLATGTWVHLKDLDMPLLVCLVALLIAVAIGLGIAFLGLAYHHHRRHMELLHNPHYIAFLGKGAEHSASERPTG